MSADAQGLAGWPLGMAASALGGSIHAGSLGESLAPASPLPPYSCLDDISWRVRSDRGWDHRCQGRDTVHWTLAWPPLASTDWSSRPTSSQTHDLGARSAGKGSSPAQRCRRSPRGGQCPPDVDDDKKRKLQSGSRDGGQVFPGPR